ncbi:MAG: hypothetical protein V5A49_02200 [Haloarcula sp.]
MGEPPPVVSHLIAVPVLLGTLGLVGLDTGWNRWRIHGHIADVTTWSDSRTLSWVPSMAATPN